MSGASNRRRGHDAERAVVRYLKERGFVDACTTRAKLGHDGATAPGDVDFHPLICLEVKDVAASAWPTWCRQAAAEAPAGTVPVVVRRTRGEADPAGWQCRIDVRALLEWTGVDANRFCNPGDIFRVDGRPWWSCVFGVVPSIAKALDAPAYSDRRPPSAVEGTAAELDETGGPR